MAEVKTRDMTEDEFGDMIREEIVRRSKIAILASSSEEFVEQIKDSISRDRGVSGLITFVQRFCFTLDPRNSEDINGLPKVIPFVPWDAQRELLEFLYHCECPDPDGVTGKVKPLDGVIDKSRDTGATWLMAIYLVWRWLTCVNFVGTMGSRKQELMDDKDNPKSFMWKCEFILRNLPTFMLPEGFKYRVHRTFGKIVNPENGAIISGESGDNMGRGGRSSIYMLDEFGFMPNQKAVIAATSDNSRCVIYCCTATPPNTEFYRLVSEGQIPHFRITWRDDPRKDESWRDDFLRKKGPAVTAMEVDVNYMGAVGNPFILPEWIESAIALHEDIVRGDQPLPDGETQALGLDVADTGDDWTVMVHLQRYFVHQIDRWRGMNPVTSAEKCKNYAESYGIDTLNFDRIGVGAGIQGYFDEKANNGEQMCFEYMGVAVSSRPSGIPLEDDENLMPSERFANLKAEMWWRTRLRFEETHRLMEGEEADIRNCIAIPRHQQLVSELSLPEIEFDPRGKVKVQSKASLRRKGFSSPDVADGLILALYSNDCDDVGVWFC